MTRQSNFVDAPWDAPLDVASALRAIPARATAAGLFLEPLASEARRAGKPLPTARDRYIPFRFYPLREHAQLLVEACSRLYPGRPVRQALRKLGRAAPKALVGSMLGKVVLASAVGPEQVLRALTSAYPLNVRPCVVQLKALSPGRAVISIEELHYFLDSHHVGAFEGALRYAGVQGTVKICSYSDTVADLLCTWST